MSRKYKHKVKKLSDTERLRRQEARKKRKERKKLEQIRSDREIRFGCILGILGFVLFFWLAAYHSTIWIIYFCLLMGIYVTLKDKSGIRNFLFRNYPDTFPWADSLKAQDSRKIFSMELATTLRGYVFILLFADLKPAFLWSVIWIICMGIGFYYAIFDYEIYRLDEKNSSMIALIISPVLLAFFTGVMNNVRWSKMIIIFQLIGFILMLILAMIRSQADLTNSFLTAFFFGCFLCTGFFLINQNFDFSEPVTHACIVVKKEYHSGKYAYHDINITDWNDSDDVVTVKISKTQYDAVKIGDTVNITVYPGALHAEHYQLHI